MDKCKTAGKDEVKAEAEGSAKANTDKEIVKILEEEKEQPKSSAMEIESTAEVKQDEGKKSAKRTEIEEEGKGEKDLVVQDKDFDFDKIEYEKESLEEKINDICQFDDKYTDKLSQVEQETKNRAAELRRHEEEKLKKYAGFIVDLQISKLETKFNFLEEYERILWQERKNQEIHQRMLLAERVSLAHQRLEMRRQINLENQRVDETGDPTNMLNLNSNITNINVDDMLSLGNTDKVDEFNKDTY